MCGRITLTRPNFEPIATELNVAAMNYRGYPIFKPRYNVAPTDTLPILTLQEGERHISPMAWGTIPKNRRGMVINGRSESFPPRSPRVRGDHRWLVRVERTEGRAAASLVPSAGSCSRRPSRDVEDAAAAHGTFAQAFVLLTTRANGVMTQVHDRMPVVLEESSLDAWMDPKAGEASLRTMLRPAPEDWPIAERASPLVNNVKNDGPELLGGLLG